MAAETSSGGVEKLNITDIDYDYVIVGAGPAGLQMAYFLQKSNRKYVVFESTDTAALFFKNQPRVNRLISINKKNNYYDEDEFNLRHDWNSLLSDDKQMRFTRYSDDLYPKPSDLHQYLNDFAQHFNLNIKYNTKVTRISKPGNTFAITTGDGASCTSRCVLMATGAVEENLPESIEGLELADTYGTYDMDKSKYKNKKVVILGGGNSAFETAHHLSDSAGVVHVVFNKRIQFAWNTHYVGDLRAVNNTIIDMYQLKSMHATIASIVTKITRKENGKLLVSFKDLQTAWKTPGWLHFDVEYDHAISCMGWKYVKPEIFDDTIRIDTCKNDRYPQLSNCWETTTENLFYIGATMGAIDRKSASGFIHGFRYNIRTLHNLLENRFFSQTLPHIKLPMRDLQAIADKVINTVTVRDSLYQMNGFLCDVITFDESGQTLYYADLPIKHVFERREFKYAQHVFILYLGYGFDRFVESFKAIDSVHAPNFSTNQCGPLLHPFIEYYSYGEYVDQTELQESIIVRFDKQACIDFPQWKLETNENYIKYFINDKVKWTDEVFNLIALSQEAAQQIFIPLTEEEKARIPPLLEEALCAESQELLPANPPPPRKVVLRPTIEEMLNSSPASRSVNKDDPNFIELY